MIKLAAFADEADASLEGQLAALKRNAIPYIELRGLDGVNIGDITEEQAHIYAARLREADIRVWSIGSPIGKVSLCEDMTAHMEKLHHVCRLARIFGTDKVRMFSFFDASDKEALVVRTLTEMVRIAQGYGVILCHENEKKIFGDTVERVLCLTEQVEGLCTVYDPANFIEVGEDIGVAMDALHSMSTYFHIKDVIAETGELVPAGYGDGRIGALIERIGEEDRVLTLEPHLRVFDGYAEIDGTEMKNKFSFADNNEAFDAAVSALKGVLLACGYQYKDGGYIK